MLAACEQEDESFFITLGQSACEECSSSGTPSGRFYRAESPCYLRNASRGNYLLVGCADAMFLVIA